MIDPKKKLRETLFHIHPLSYRIKPKGPDVETMTKRAFVEIVTQLREIEDRRDFMESELGLDMTQYEDKFFAVIENLFKLAFTKEQLAFIQLYIYQLVPDTNWDGTITIEVNKVEKVVNFQTPEDVWNVIKNL